MMTTTDNDGDYWFAPKRYGYGAGLPLTWQGWVLCLVYCAVRDAGGLSAGRAHDLRLRRDHAHRDRAPSCSSASRKTPRRLALALGRRGVKAESFVQ